MVNFGIMVENRDQNMVLNLLRHHHHDKDTERKREREMNKRVDESVSWRFEPTILSGTPRPTLTSQRERERESE